MLLLLGGRLSKPLPSTTRPTLQNLVRVAGVEPAHLSARDFKSLVSTNSTILATSGAPGETRTLTPCDTGF